MAKPKIPTLVGLILIVIGAISGVIFISRQTDFLPRARPEYIPQKVKLTNITDTGFTISWLTQQATIGFIKYGITASDLTTTVTDDRDQLTGESGEFKTHYITVQNLNPATTYYFKLGSHGQQLYDNNGDAFSLTTGPALSPPPPVNMVSGTVLTAAQTPAEGSLLYLTIPNATPLSALVKQAGTWSVDLSNARSSDLSQAVTVDTQTNLDILVRDADGSSTQATANLSGGSTLPDIIIGQGISSGTSASAPTSSAALPESKFSFAPIEATEPEVDATLSVTSPAKDGTKVSSAPPNFTGSAPPDTQLTITLHSAPIFTDSVTSSSTGQWSWTPPGNLSPGTHTLTIAYNDQSGILHTLTRTFEVQAASDTGPGYTATPSASISPTVKPTLVPTIAPTTSLAPTTGPSSAPTAVPTPQITPADLPVSGSSTPTLMLLILGTLSMVVGWTIIKFNQA